MSGASSGLPPGPDRKPDCSAGLLQQPAQDHPQRAATDGESPPITGPHEPQRANSFLVGQDAPLGKGFKRVVIASGGKPDPEHADLRARERRRVGVRLPVAQPGCAGAIGDIHALLVTEIPVAVQIHYDHLASKDKSRFGPT